MAISPGFRTTIVRDTLSVDNVKVNSGEQSEIGMDHTMPIRHITINNRDFRTERIINNVTFLKVIERADGLSTAEIHIFNEDSRYTNDPLLRHQNIVQIWTGYSSFDGRSIEKRGIFRINDIDMRFNMGKKSEIVLYCVSPEYDLSFTDKRRIWEKMTDFQIAKAIAEENGFLFAGQRTSVTYPKIAQIAESDMKFLEERAKLYGYDVYVDDYTIANGREVKSNVPVLHFHEPVFLGEPLGPFYYGGENAAAALKYFEAKVDSWYRGIEYIGTQFDPITKEFIDVKSSDDENIKFQKQLAGNKRKSQDLRDITDIGGKQPTRFLNGEGHFRNREEVSRQTQKFSEFSRYAVTGCGAIIGLEKFKKRRVVQILGIGRFSGFYYITKAIHTITGKKGYTLEFEVIRIAPGEYSQRKKNNARSILDDTTFFSQAETDVVPLDKLKQNPGVLVSPAQGPSNNVFINLG